MTPCESAASRGVIESLCAGIPGVRALRVDADHGRIHVLYDGTDAAIARVEKAVQMSGRHVQLIGCIAPLASAPVARQAETGKCQRVERHRS